MKARGYHNTSMDVLLCAQYGLVASDEQVQGEALPHLSGEPDAAGVLVKDEKPLRAEARVVGVVTLRAQVAGVAQQEQGHHVDQRVAGCMQALPEGQLPLSHLPPCGLRHPDVRRLRACRHLLGSTL